MQGPGSSIRRLFGPVLIFLALVMIIAGILHMYRRSQSSKRLESSVMPSPAIQQVQTPRTPEEAFSRILAEARSGQESKDEPSLDRVKGMVETFLREHPDSEDSRGLAGYLAKINHAQHYLQAAEEVRNSVKRRPIEGLWKESKSLVRLFDRPFQKSGYGIAEFFAGNLPGFHAVSGRTILKLDRAFFKRLAELKGMPEDEAFFKFLSQEEEIVQTQEDGKTCVDYRAASDLYRKWAGFNKDFGSAYEADVKESIFLVEDRLTGAAEPCSGDARGVRETLESLMRDFPGLTLVSRQ